MRKLGQALVVVVGLFALLQVPSYLLYAVTGAVGLVEGDAASTLLSLPYLLPAGVELAFGLYLIVRRRELAESLFEDQVLEAGISSVRLLQVALLALGVWLIVIGASSGTAVVAANAGVLLEATLVGATGQVPLQSDWLGLVRPIVLLCSGIALLRYADRWAHRLLHVQEVESAPAAPMPSTSRPACPSCGATYDPSDYDPEFKNPRCTNCGGPLNVTRA